MFTQKQFETPKRYAVPRYLRLDEIKQSGVNKIEVVMGHSPSLRRTLTGDSSILKVIEFFLESRTEIEMSNEFSLSKKVSRQTIQLLQREGILKEQKSVPQSFDRYDRHLLFYDLAGVDAISVQKRISQSRVALIGMGGIGNWISSALIGAGFKELRLIDFDRIELSNLTRQILFSEEDIGKVKVDVAAAALKKKNKNTKITTYIKKINGIESIKKCLKDIDFVILSADKPARIHDWVDAACVKGNIPYLNVGYRDGVGIVGPLTVPGKTSCYQCFKPKLKVRAGGLSEKIFKAFDERYQAPSFGPLNGVVSSIAAVEAVKYLGSFGISSSLDCELSVDPMDFGISKVKYRRDLKCLGCG